MKQTIKIAAYVVLMCAAGPLKAQQRASDVMTILRASVSAQAGKVMVQSVDLTGAAEYIAGSDDEMTQFMFKGTNSGSSRFELLLSSGTITEIRSDGSSSVGTGGWYRGDRTRVPFAGHNMLTDSAWCFPLFVVQRLVSNTREAVTFVGTENGLVHFQAYQEAPAGTPSKAAPFVQSLSRMDLYLDPVNFLPSKLSFQVHPDDNALVDIPVVVQFEGYRTFDGVSVPSHIEKYINGTLALDMHVNSAIINSGAQPSDFSW